MMILLRIDNYNSLAKHLCTKKLVTHLTQKSLNNYSNRRADLSAAADCFTDLE